jgi:hypothetical protein
MRAHAHTSLQAEHIEALSFHSGMRSFERQSGGSAMDSDIICGMRIETHVLASKYKVNSFKLML